MSNNAYHAELMRGYYAHREAQFVRAEQWSLGYETELTMFYEDVEPRVTFKAWLIASRKGSDDHG